MLLRRSIGLLLPFTWVAACGGRYLTTAEGDDLSGGAGSVAGATAGVGGSGRGGSSSKAGGRSGGTSSRAGSSSVGGTTNVAGSVGTAAAGGVCVCPVDPNCDPPLRAVPDANGCCSHCEPDLMQCVAAEQRYQAYRDQVIQKYQTLGCMRDSDCGLLFDKNECGATSCGAPLLSSQIMAVTRMLDDYAHANCSFACPPPPGPQCPVIPAPKCVLNRCQ